MPPANSHVGHGDEFQQQGDVRQVKANADSDALRIIGRRSEEIPALLGFAGRDELIHRDDLVLS